MKKKNHMWTREELKKVLKLWETHTTAELSTEFGVKKSAIAGLATKFRKAGYKLTKKSRKGYLDSLIKQVIKEAK